MTVFIQTNRFVPGEFYSNAASFGIEPTQDSLLLIRDALRGAKSIYRKGFRYWKAGVMLNELIDAKTAPVQMFATRDPKQSARLMAAVDSVNGRFGRGMLRPAVSGVDRRWTAKAGVSIAALYDAVERAGVRTGLVLRDGAGPVFVVPPSIWSR